ncbi:MAG: hypothetical protein HZA37_01655 [Parcubacteria group bacterium]|nr:hypothetical protein [Parcubacteria group bacterium]
MFIVKRRRQNPKISFLSNVPLRFSTLYQENKNPSRELSLILGVGGAANKNDRKFLGFAPREQGARGRGASVIRQNSADFARNTFELRPIHTANFQNGFRE